MNKAELSKLVSEGFELDQVIKAKSKRLEEIKETLANAADGQVLEFAGDGCKATVNYSARLYGRVDEALLPRCKKLAGDYFDKLFCFAPIDKFKDVAKAIMGASKADELARLLTGLPAPRVSFKEL